jgi:hypothetical protein
MIRERVNDREEYEEPPGRTLREKGKLSVS